MKPITYLVLFCLLGFITSEELLFESFGEEDGSLAEEANKTIAEYDCHGKDQYNDKVCPKAIVISNIANSLTTTFTGITNAIKTTHSREIVDKIMVEGFQKLHIESTVKFTAGINNFEKYIEIIKKYTLKELPEKYKDEFNEGIEVLEYIDDIHRVSKAELVFEGTSPQDKMNSFSFAGSGDKYGRKHILIAYMKSDFKLAPNLFIWRQSDSYLGGAFSNTKDEIKEVPQSLGLEKYKTMVDCFQWISYKVMLDFLGIKADASF